MNDPSGKDRDDDAGAPSSGAPRSRAGAPAGMSASAIRELFRVEARQLLRGMDARLEQLGSDLGDRGGLAEIAARGHALKGSAALAELPCLSRAGMVLQRAAELAADGARRNHDGARALVEATRSAIEPARRMLEASVDADPTRQVALLDELLASFDARDRAELERDIATDEAIESAVPEFEERPGEPGPTAALDLDADAVPPPGEGLGDESSDQAMGDEGSGIDPALAEILRETFLAELGELLSEVPDLLAGLVDPAQQADLCADLGRIFHTVKGSAATVGRNDLRDVGLVLQDAFEAPLDDPAALPLSPAFFAAVREPLSGLFLAAGLEPPSDALAIAAGAASASLADEPPGDAELAGGDADAADGIESDGSAAAAPPPAVEPEIMEAFAIDADAALDACETALLRLERDPNDHHQLRVLFRQFHTLKGAAAAVGLTRIAEQLHAGETFLEGVIEQPGQHPADAVVELLLELVDSAAGMLAELRGVPHDHRVIDDVPARIAEVLARPTALAPLGTPQAHAAPSAPQADHPPVDHGAGARDAAATAGHDLDTAIVRVHASRLDLLLNRVSELVVSRTRMDDTMSAMQELKDKLRNGKVRLHETIEGLRGFEFASATVAGDAAPAPADAPPAAPEAKEDAARGDDFTDLEFDKYDDFGVLTRTLVELAADTSEIVEQLGSMIETLADETRQVSKVTSSLQRTVSGMRLLSLDTLYRRLQRPIRDAARGLGKQVELECSGGEVQVDRALLESLYGPLLHLVRNAVSHGIESMVERRAARKPDVGKIEIRAAQQHGSVEVTVRDDGRGLDFGAIRAKAEHLGLVPPGAPIAREQLAALIFRAGFTTQGQVTDLAGRGIGMDVVVSEVEHLRGTVSVESTDGKGAVFRLSLPLKTMIDQVLVLRAGPHVFALSHGPIETVLNVEAEHLVASATGPRLRLGEDTIPLVSLSALVGIEGRPPTQTAVILRAGEQRMALLVDRIEAQREAVVRPLGRLFAGHPFISSATFSGDGQVIFVLDAGRMEGLLGTSWALPTTDLGAEAPHGAADADEATVLWADDSISVRKLAGHFLAAEGFTAHTAVDGRDALEKLRTGRYRVLVTDLEMPRMHGYDLLREIRNDAKLEGLPVIVCSSRSSEKHRRRAREAGAQGYLTKPFTREALAAAVREVLEPAPRPDAAPTQPTPVPASGEAAAAADPAPATP